MQYLRVKNWENFQHYKDRSPPWIKLQRDLLRDYDFLRLQDASKLQLILIWLLASQLDNKIPADPDYIKNQIGIKGELRLKDLIDNGFVIDDSNALATRKQSAVGETEAETYRTDREEAEKRQSGRKAPPRPDDVSENIWEDHLRNRRAKKQPLTETALNGMRKEAAKMGMTLEQALTEACTRGWGSFKAEWMTDDKKKTKLLTQAKEMLDNGW